MYAKGTILTLKAQRDPDPETDEEFAYNEVEVIGESPVSKEHEKNPDGSQRWMGEDAKGVIVVPKANFGGTLDEPFGKLRLLYDVKSVPEVEVVTNVRIPVVDATSAAAGPTPEEVFAEKAPGIAPEPGQIRARTSPLGDVANPATKGPLD